MACLSNSIETSILTHQFRTGTWSKPTTVAIALCTAAPTASSTGATLTEVSNSGTAYARQTLNPLDANWAINLVSGSEVISNSSAITFPVATANYGSNVTYIALVDSATYGAGNMLAFGAVSTPQTVTTGNQVTIAASALTLSLS